MNLTLENVWIDDNKRKRVFSWLSRIGASPKFSSRPVGWYQQHQCAAIDYLLASWARNSELRCKAGVIQGKDSIGLWLDVVSVNQLYTIADNRG